MESYVLIFTRTSDYHADRLSKELERIGVQAVRVHKDRISEYAFDIVGNDLYLKFDSKLYPASCFSSAFVRILPSSSDFGITGAEGDVSIAEYIAIQQEALFQEWIFTLGLFIPFYNSFSAFTQSMGKAYQRVLAERVMLSCPPTYVGCDNVLAASFVKEVAARNREVCTKPIANKIIKNNGARLTRFTEKLPENLYESLGDVEGCPVIFQEYVEKQYELRGCPEFS